MPLKVVDPSADAAEMQALALQSGNSPTHCQQSQDLQQYGQHQRRQNDQRCRPACGFWPAAIFTLLGTAALSAGIFTDYWERIDYNASSIELIARHHNGSHRLTWLFNNTVARIVLHPAPHSLVMEDRSGKASSSGGAAKLPSSVWALKRNSSRQQQQQQQDYYAADDQYVNSIDRRPLPPLPPPPPQQTRANNKVKRDTGQQQLNKSRRKKRSRASASSSSNLSKGGGEPGVVYLIPLHGGIWHLCVDLPSDQLRILQGMGLKRESTCIRYLAENSAPESDAASMTLSSGRFPPTSHYLHHHVQSKMHNLSISCAMVCVILLASAALLGVFGVLKRELSAVLITGVMYILAALFAVFSLVIMHCKRNARRETGIVDDQLVDSTVYNESRIFTNSWSMLLGWIGSLLVLLASLFWLFLAKVMRYNPLTFC